MATTDICWDVVTYFVERLRDDETLNGVTVDSGWPGDAPLEAIWVDAIVSADNIPLMKAGRKARDNLFTVPFRFRVFGKTTNDDAGQRLSVLIAALENILAGSDDPTEDQGPTLNDLDGVIDAVLISKDRKPIGDLGPGKGKFAVAELIVQVHARVE